MRICITSAGSEMASPVDPRFGRAANLLVVDTETEDVRTVEGATGSSHGAGVQAAQSVVGAGASALVTGRIGPRAFDVLAAAEIPVYLTPPTTVAQAIRDLTADRLEQVDRATGKPHGGMQA
jgi:predicted Fe-Mo cluster-binding NifX family protein